MVSTHTPLCVVEDLNSQESRTSSSGYLRLWGFVALPRRKQTKHLSRHRTPNMTSKCVLLFVFLTLLFVSYVAAEKEESISDQAKTVFKQIKTNIKEGWKALVKALQPYVDEYLTPYLKGAYTFTDQTSKDLFGVDATKLPRHAEKNAPEVVTAILTLAWLIVALVTAIFFSAGTSLYFMALLFLLYGVFGAAWCLKRVIYTSGFVLYLVRALANNPIIAACIIVSLYIMRKLFNRRTSEMGLRQLNHAVLDLHSRIEELEAKIESISTKLEEQAS